MMNTVKKLTHKSKEQCEHFIKKWKDLTALDKKWVSYIKSNYCKPGTRYGLIKTNKENNPVRVITSWCGTAIEYFSFFVKKYLYKEVNKIVSRVKDEPDMLNIIEIL